MNKILLIAMVALCLFTGCGKKNEEKKPSNNTSNTIGEKEFEGIKFTDGKISCADNSCRYTATATNTSENEYKFQKFTITFKDKNGKAITTLEAKVPYDSIAKGESKPIDTSTDQDLTKATTIEINVEK